MNPEQNTLNDISSTDFPTPEPSILSKFNLMNKLPDLLRILGAAALIIAMYSFLMKGWDSGNDIYRYLFMLGHTGVLAAVGLASGHWLKESKGARLLLTLALVSIPANFAILGAFIFSQTTAVDLSFYPHYVAWTVDSLSAALFTGGGALLVLVPVTLLGFTVLARSLSKKLSFLFLLSNASLLLPLRDPQLIGLIVLVFTFLNVFFSYKTSQHNIVTKTHEGLIALGLLALPLAVLMGRSLWLYSLDAFLLTVLTITSFFLLRQLSLIFQQNSKTRLILDRLSLIPAIIITPLLSQALFGSTLVMDELAIPLAALVSAVMIFDMAQRKSSSAYKYRYIAIGILFISLLFNMYVFTSLVTALTNIIIGFGLLVMGVKKQQRGVLISGIVLILLGMALQFYELFHHFEIGSWISLASLGVLSIIIASTIESKGGKIKLHIETWKTKLNQWEK